MALETARAKISARSAWELVAREVDENPMAPALNSAGTVP